MTSADSIDQILSEALEIPPAERAAFLDRTCGPRTELKARVQELIAALERNPEFLAAPTAAIQVRRDSSDVYNSHAAAPPHAAGATFGAYRLLERLGEGGFGEVWLAEQHEPVRRRVALKIIKVGMDSKEVLARFEAERQALALIDHPNVARVFDAGRSQSGGPYFVMEHVPGLPITDYCDASRLRIRQRLELFIEICHAVQHAHSKGIIHRDLKPSNILVTLIDGRPVPKVIDFGIAKACPPFGAATTPSPLSGVAPSPLPAGTTGGSGRVRLTDRTLHTEVGRLMGTPEYMSPEQAGSSGIDVDTRSDVYSLGVILYQLLTGTLPFEPQTLRTADYSSMVQLLCEQEPPTPSSRLSTLGAEPDNHSSGATPREIAARRSVDFAALRRQIRGELDWIVMKCLEKDRARRYETADGLAADVQRHLHGEVVRARPPTVTYRTLKFVRRHLVLVAATAIVVLALATGATLAEFGMLRARDQAEQATNAAQEAKQQADRANELLNFYKASIVGVVDPWNQSHPGLPAGKNITVEDILHHQEQLAGVQFQGLPDLECDVRMSLGHAYWALGDGPRCLENGRRADELARGGGVPDRRRIAVRRLFSYWADLYAPDSYDVLSMGRANYEEAQRILGPADSETIEVGVFFVRYLLEAHQVNEAERVLQELDAHRDPANAWSQDEIWRRQREVFRQQGRFLDMELTSRRAIALLDEQHSSAAVLYSNAYRGLGLALGEQGRFQEAVAALRLGLNYDVQAYGADNADLRQPIISLASFLAELDPAAAEELVQPVWEKTKNSLDASSRSEFLLFLMAKYLNVVGRYSEAEQLARDFFARPAPEKTLWPRWRSYAVLGQALCGQRKWQEAETALREGLSNLEGVAPDHFWTARFRDLLGQCLMEQERFAEAEVELTRAFERESRNQGVEFQLRKITEVFVDLYTRWDRAEPGQGYLARAQDWQQRLR